MKSGKNIKILLPVVIIIWGVVIYKVVDAFSSESINIINEQEGKFKPPKNIQKDTFSLVSIEVDPFLGTIYANSKGHTPKTSYIRKPKIEKSWPTIGYFGIVTDKKASSSVYIVDINGRQYLLRKGDTIQNLRVINGTKAKISIQYESETKEFPIM